MTGSCGVEADSGLWWLLGNPDLISQSSEDLIRSLNTSVALQVTEGGPLYTRCL
jgi:hypothetical protein